MRVLASCLVAATGAGDMMEKLFISILNRTLLLGCVFLLACAVVIALLAGITFLNSKNPAIDKGYVSVAYMPLTPLTPNEAAPGTSEDLTDRPTQEDLKLRALATPSCQSLGHISAAISNKRLDMHAAGLTACEKAQAIVATQFGAKAENYLNESATYFTQLAGDPHLATRYPDSGGDEQTRQTIDEMVRDFGDKFQAQVNVQDTKNQAAAADALTQRLASMTYLTVAGAAFLGFLSIAFLIVFLRIEKHLEKMSETGPVRGL